MTLRLDTPLVHRRRAAFAARPWRHRQRHADAIDDITAAGQINVGIFSDFPPFSSASADMSLKGYDIDVAQAIADALKVKLNLVSVTGQNRIPYLTEKRVDILMSVGYSKEREEVIDFAAAYAPYYIAVIGPADAEGRRQGRPRRQVDRRQPRHAGGHLADRGRAGLGRHQALRQLQRRHPGLHLGPDPADGGRQRCRRAGAGAPGSAEAGTEVPAPDLAVAYRPQQERGPPEDRRSTTPSPRCWPTAR